MSPLPGPRHDLHQFDLRPAAAARLVEAVGPLAGCTVLEPGPGTGALTAALLAAGARVQAVEIDPARGAHLRERFATGIAAGHLGVTVGDVRHHLPLLPAGWRVVGNPPFKHGAELLRLFLLEDLPGGPPSGLDLLLQDQAAQRLVGRPGRLGQLAVLLRLWGMPVLGPELPRDAVEPTSHVPLRLLSVRRRETAPDPEELRRIDRLLAQAFAGPPTVRAALRGLATPAILKRQGAAHDWDPQGHPRAVPPEAWRELVAFLHGLGRI